MAQKPWTCVLGDNHEVLLARPPIQELDGTLCDDSPCHIQQFEHGGGRWDLITEHTCDVHHHLIVWEEAILRKNLHQG